MFTVCNKQVFSRRCQNILYVYIDLQAVRLPEYIQSKLKIEIFTETRFTKPQATLKVSQTFRLGTDHMLKSVYMYIHNYCLFCLFSVSYSKNL